jgi:hypothetical protein
MWFSLGARSRVAFVNRRLVRRPSLALGISLLALFVALGRTSYAAFRLPRKWPAGKPPSRLESAAVPLAGRKWILR